MISITIADGTAEKVLLDNLRQRSGETDKRVTASVTEILENVKARGDEAVKEYTLKFDGRCPEAPEVTRAQMEQAVADADPRFVEALTNAMNNIKEFLAFDKVFAVGGSFMMKGDIVANCKAMWEVIGK